MTAAQPERIPEGITSPTREELDAFDTRRFASVEELVETWFAIHGLKTTVRPYDPAEWGDATG